MPEFTNPFRPGAGHQPPYLAGRQAETREFARLLEQHTILENMLLTGLRGVGKTVLLDSLKPLAVENRWIWIGADLNESSSISEENIAIRLCTDLSLATSSIVVSTASSRAPGFTSETTIRERTLTYAELASIYTETPGLRSTRSRRSWRRHGTPFPRPESHGESCSPMTRRKTSPITQRRNDSRCPFFWTPFNPSRGKTCR